jgi:hypothetical protein
MGNRHLIYRMLAEAHAVVRAAWKATKDPAKRAALETKKLCYEALMQKLWGW